jgi:hypothetical protein
LEYHVQDLHYVVQRKPADSAEPGLVGTLSQASSQRHNMKLPFYGTIFSSPNLLQSVLGHSAIMLSASINNIQ